MESIPGTTVANNSKLWSWLVVFGFFSILGLLNFSIIHTDSLATGRMNYDWREHFINEITGAYSAFILIPALVLIWRRYPVYSNWWKLLPLYLVVVAAFGAFHTTLMFLSRSVLYPLVLNREFYYGALGYRYLMEFQKQIIWIPGTFLVLEGIRHLRQHQQQRLQAARLQTQLAYSRLEQMRQQINPHFLFNSLNLISSKVYEDSEMADQLISDLSELLRKSLDMGRNATTSLQEELGFLENYITIMQSRFPERVVIERSIDPECLKMEVPSLILQPVVENSFKHRLESRPGNVTIFINCQSIGQYLEIAIGDSFKPDSRYDYDSGNSIGKSSGTGLANLKERLHCQYGNQASFQYGALDDLHFKTIIRIPLSPFQLDHEKTRPDC